jgi:hypothetical protein
MGSALDKTAKREALVAELKADYLGAAAMPWMTTVHVPTDEQPRRRAAFLDVFRDDIENDDVCARLVSILGRSDEGKALLAELAQGHGEHYAEDWMVACSQADEVTA